VYVYNIFLYREALQTTTYFLPSHKSGKSKSQIEYAPSRNHLGVLDSRKILKFVLRHYMHNKHGFQYNGFSAPILKMLHSMHTKMSKGSSEIQLFKESLEEKFSIERDNVETNTRMV
jgi:hypothetical protein